MSVDDVETTDEEQDELDGEGEGEGARRRLSGKKLVLVYVLPILILLGAGGGAGYYFFLASPSAQELAEAMGQEKIEDPTKIVFYDLPDILVNLNSGGKQNNYLKVTIALELKSVDDLPVVHAVLPRIIDNFQIYLRELRLEDLNGSAGPVRLKEELLVRLNASMDVSRINDILFKEILVQ